MSKGHFFLVIVEKTSYISSTRKGVISVPPQKLFQRTEDNVQNIFGGRSVVREE